jgi:hypothetical protein
MSPRMSPTLVIWGFFEPSRGEPMMMASGLASA